MDVVTRGKPTPSRAFPTRGAIYWVDLDPTRGSEIKKTRPCVVVSPDELNAHLRTVIVAPMTTGGRPYPWRIEYRFEGQEGRVALDQLRTVDRERLTQFAGVLPEPVMATVLGTLAELFAA